MVVEGISPAQRHTGVDGNEGTHLHATSYVVEIPDLIQFRPAALDQSIVAPGNFQCGVDSGGAVGCRC